MAAIGTREGLLAALQPRRDQVTLPDGSTVTIRTLTAAERLAIGNACSTADGRAFDTARFSALVVAACVVDDAGQRLLRDDDMQGLMDGAADVFEALFDGCQRLNGLGSKGAEAAAKN